MGACTSSHAATAKGGEAAAVFKHGAAELTRFATGGASEHAEGGDYALVPSDVEGCRATAAAAGEEGGGGAEGWAASYCDVQEAEADDGRRAGDDAAAGAEVEATAGAATGVVEAMCIGDSQPNKYIPDESSDRASSREHPQFQPSSVDEVTWEEGSQFHLGNTTCMCVSPQPRHPPN